MSLFAPEELPVPQQASVRRKRSAPRASVTPIVSAMTDQFDLFGDDPFAAIKVIERSEEADLDINIALSVNPGLVGSDATLDDIQAAIENLSLARFARRSGADVEETREVLDRAGIDGAMVMEQLAEAEKLIGSSDADHNEADLSSLSDAEIQAFLSDGEDEVEALTGHADADGDVEAEGRMKADDSLATSSLSSLMRQLSASRYEPPTEDQEKALGQRLMSTDEKVRSAARNELVERNMRYLIFVAKTFRWTKRSMQDLVAFGVSGLMHAAEKFDHTKGRFTTYAQNWIRQSIQREVLRDSTFNTPVYLATKESRLRKLAEACPDPLAKKRMIEEAQKVRDEINGRKAAPTSLDTTPTGDDEESSAGLHNLFASEEAGPDELMERKQLVMKLIETAKGLHDTRAGEIFLMHLGLHEDYLGEPQSMPQMTEHFPLQRERIRQLYLQAAGQVYTRMERWARGAENLPEGFKAAIKA